MGRHATPAGLILGADTAHEKGDWDVAPNADLSKYDVVYITGTVGAYLKVTAADADLAAMATQPLWLMTTPAHVESPEKPTGYANPMAMVVGTADAAVDTSSAAIGDPVFLSNTAGGWSLSPGTYRRRIGTVTKVHATEGEWFFDGRIGAGILTGTAIIATTNQDVAVTLPAALTGKPAWAVIIGENPLASPPIADAGGALNVDRVFWDGADLKIEANAAASHATGVMVQWFVVAD